MSAVEPAPGVTGATGPDDALHGDDLEAQRRFLLASLADLERERAAGDIDEPDYEALKDDYTVRAADVLRRLDAGPAAAAEPVAVPRRRVPLARRVGVATAVAAVAVGSGVLVARSSGERVAGQQLSGTVRTANPQQAQIDAGLTEAGRLMGSDPVGAVKAFDKVLKIDPQNVEALTYRGWLLFQAGLLDEALVFLDRAVAADPAYADAYAFRGIARFRGDGDAAGAVVDLQQYLRLAPDSQMAALVQQTLAEAQQAAAGTTTVLPTTVPPTTT